MDHRAAYTLGVKRLRRRLTAWFALLAICFVQIATAAHACTFVEAAASVSAVAVDNADPCAEMGMADAQGRPVLCLEHCQSGMQLVDPYAHAVADAPAAAPILLVWVSDVDVRLVPPQPVIARATARPVFASSSRLRI